jgi:hypothetical protein
MIPQAASRSGSRKGNRPNGPFPQKFAILTLLLFLAATGAALAWSAPAEVPAPKAPADSTAAAPDTTALPHRVIAYYFHTSYRCVSCRKIEAYATEAIAAGFPNELKDGRLVWRVVNIEEKGNEHFVNDYKIFTKSVILVDEWNGQQRSWKNLPKIWELLGDKDRFLRYVRSETSVYLTAGKQ